MPGIPGTEYLYQVRYVNGCGLNEVTTGTTITEQPYGPSPLDNNAAFDLDECCINGVVITWSADPQANRWGDGDLGTRTYDISRDGSPIQTGIRHGTTSYTDLSGSTDILYTYSVTYRNGCNVTNNTSPGQVAADTEDVDPCPAVGASLMLVKSEPNAVMDWTDVTCSDLDHYVVYGATTYDAIFPASWTAIGYPATSDFNELLSSDYIAYRIVSSDACNNQSP